MRFSVAFGRWVGASIASMSTERMAWEMREGRRVSVFQLSRLGTTKLGEGIRTVKVVLTTFSFASDIYEALKEKTTVAL